MSSPFQPQASSLERSLSQSITSEDSQTVLIDTPSLSTPATPQAQPSPEPRKCWICFSDETEDTANSSEWISPCPCALQAHQTCLLDWIADLESPKRKIAKKIECPQCSSDIKILQPHRFAIGLTRALSRTVGGAIWPAVFIAAVDALVAVLTRHGAYTATFLMSPQEFRKLVGSSGQLPQRLSIIPILLIISRTSVGDIILPLLPGLYLITNRRRDYNLSTRPDLWICAIPALRAFYFGLYRKWALPLEKAWLEEIQPSQPVHEGGMDFELGVQIEVNPAPENNPEPPQPPAQLPQPPVRNFNFAIPDLVRVTMGALALPFASHFMGEILNITLPKAWTTYIRPTYWKPQGMTGILQSKAARTVVGGCLFIVMKDSFFLYCKYSMAHNFRTRRVLNYNEYPKPWYRKNIEELIMRR